MMARKRSLSTAGDLGYSTGPYEFRKDAADAVPASFGNYITIWKRQPDGTLKVLIDLGTANPRPDRPIGGFRADQAKLAAFVRPRRKTRLGKLI